MTRRAWLAFAAISLIWGVPYLFIKIADEGGVTPLVLAWSRVTLAAVVLLLLAWRSGKLPTLRGRWRWVAAYGIAEAAIPFPMIAAGEEHVASSVTAIVIASVPLIGALLALRFDQTERPTPLRAVGLVVGFAGVIALVGIDVVGSGPELLGTGAILIAATGYAIGPMVIKHRLAGTDSGAMVGASLAIVSVLLTPFAVFDLPRRWPSTGGIAALLVLALICTAAALVVYTVLIREAGTSRATVITYVNPVVAVALGVAVLGERPGAGAVAGLLLILAGSWLSTGGGLPPRLRAVDPFAAQMARRRGRSGTGNAGAMSEASTCAA